MRLAHTTGRITVVALLGLVGACTDDPEPTEYQRLDRPVPSGSSGAGPGGGAAWSMAVERGEHLVSVVGATVIVPDKGALSGRARADGRQLWQHAFDEESTYTIASGLVVIQDGSPVAGGRVEVLDTATGATVWRTDETAHGIVRQDAVYLTTCPATSKKRTGDCTITARSVTDGGTLWTTKAATFSIDDDTIGGRPPDAPGAVPYLAALTWENNTRMAALMDTRTGKLLPGRLPNRAWYRFAAGRTLVVTNNDPPSGDRRCVITMAAVDARTGAKAWSGETYSGRRKDGDCNKTLSDHGSGREAIGVGTRIAASTTGGRPQVLDLATGRTVWAGATPGVPIDGTADALLVRRYADEGDFSLLDAATGATRWTAPDLGLSGQSASWDSAVTANLVAIMGSDDDRPVVVVHDLADGSELGRFSSWLAGAGDDWVAVTRGDADGLTLRFLPF